jgi:hypothetical protein
MELKVRFKPSVCSATAVLLVVAALVGCDARVNPDDAVAAANSNNIQRVTNLYLAYQTNNNWMGPDDESKLKDFIRSLPESQLTRIGVNPGQLDDLFISERDGQPFKIRYKVLGNMRGSTEPVVFDAEGSGGQRMVGFLDMTQREVDAAEYDSLFAKGSAGATPQQ